MNITPTQSTLQAFGSALNTATPASQVRQPAVAETVDRPTPNTVQRADAAPRTEAPTRPDADSRPPAQTDRPGSRVDLLV